jgi:integrase
MKPGSAIDNRSTGIRADDLESALALSKALGEFKYNMAWHNVALYDRAKQVHPLAAKLFYAPLKPQDASWARAKGTYVNWPDILADGNWIEEALEVEAALKRAREIEATSVEKDKTIADLEIENRALKAQIQQSPHALPRKITVSEAYAAWCADFDCRSEREKKFVLRRVRFSLESLEKVLLADLTAQQLKAAILANTNVPRGPRKAISTSAHERNRRIRDCKRFIVWCLGTYEIRPLKRVAFGLRYSSPQVIAKRQEIDLLDMKAVTALLTATDQGAFESVEMAALCRGMIGLLAYAGLRLGELCALRWEHVDETAQLISLVDSVTKQLKTEKSNRVVKPLPELWPLIQRLRPITGAYDFVIPYDSRGNFENKSFLVEEDGKAIAKLMTRKLIRLEPILGLGRQIPMRARRTCRTLMLSRGVPAHHVDLMLGHSAQVGLAHYTHCREVISAFKYERLHSDGARV